MRRHGVQVFDENARLLVSLRPMGNPRERFHDITRIARRGRLLFVVERGAGRIQVFRDFDFHLGMYDSLRDMRDHSGSIIGVDPFLEKFDQIMEKKMQEMNERYNSDRRDGESVQIRIGG